MYRSASRNGLSPWLTIPATIIGTFPEPEETLEGGIASSPAGKLASLFTQIQQCALKNDPMGTFICRAVQQTIMENGAPSEDLYNDPDCTFWSMQESMRCDHTEMLDLYCDSIVQHITVSTTDTCGCRWTIDLDFSSNDLRHPGMRIGITSATRTSLMKQ